MSSLLLVSSSRLGGGGNTGLNWAKLTQLMRRNGHSLSYNRYITDITDFVDGSLLIHAFSASEWRNESRGKTNWYTPGMQENYALIWTLLLLLWLAAQDSQQQIKTGIVYRGPTCNSQQSSRDLWPGMRCFSKSRLQLLRRNTVSRQERV